MSSGRNLIIASSGNAKFATVAFLPSLPSTGTALTSVDIRNPASLAEIGSVATTGDENYSAVLDIEKAVVYVSKKTQLSTVDVSDPASMTQLSSYLVINSSYERFRPQALDIKNDVLFWASENRLISIDVSNPASPVELQEIIDFSIDNPYDSALDLDKSLLYLTSSGRGLDVYDVSDPSNMIRKFTYDVNSVYFMGVALDVSRELLFIATNRELHILDISDPNSISFVSRIDPEDFGGDDVGCLAFDPLTKIVYTARSVFSGGSTLDSRVSAIDVSNPSTPSYLSSVVIPGKGIVNRKMQIDQIRQVLYVRDDYFTSINVQDPTSMSIMDSIDVDYSIGTYGLCLNIDGPQSTNAYSR